MDEEEVWGVLRKAVDDALDMLIETRTREGENLKTDLLEKLHQMSCEVTNIEERYPKILEEYEARLREKVDELLGDKQIDEGRLAMRYARVESYQNAPWDALRIDRDARALRPGHADLPRPGIILRWSLLPCPNPHWKNSLLPIARRCAN